MHCLIVNGWSANQELWHDFLAMLPETAEVEVVDLKQVMSRDQWIDMLAEKITPETVLIGWSLGGELALDCVLNRQAQPRALCLLQTNPCFVASEKWPHGMHPNSFEEFKLLVETSPEEFKRRFAHMMVEGSDTFRADRRALRIIYESADTHAKDVLLNGLKLLAELDLSESLDALQVPVLAVFGAEDKLVPPEAASVFANYRVISGMGHLPCLSYGQQVKNELMVFLDGVS